MEKIVRSELKTAVDGFNDLVSRDKIKIALDARLYNYSFVDVIGKDFWQNDLDTIIVLIPDRAIAAFSLGQFAVDCHADEFNVYRDPSGEGWIVRLWWD